MNSSSPIVQKRCNPTEQRTCLADVQRIVVKVGSSTISEGAHLNEAALDGLVHDLALVKQEGVEVILVTSGAIAAGWPQLGLKQRPHTLPHLQAAAAVGQIRLMAAYKDRFSNYRQRAASMLLTRDDFSNRERYTRMNDTMRALLNFDVIPIINENDTVAVDEIKVGDNDTLSAYVTNLAQAQLLIILSDQAGFYTADPRHNPNSELIHTVTTISDEIWKAAGTAWHNGWHWRDGNKVASRGNRHQFWRDDGNGARTRTTRCYKALERRIAWYPLPSAISYLWTQTMDRLFPTPER